MSERYPSFRPTPGPRGERTARPATPPPPPPSRSGVWEVIGVIAAGLVVGLAIVYLVLPRWLGTGTSPAPTATTAPAAAAADTRPQAITLLYVSEDGAALVPVSRKVPLPLAPVDQARTILAAQLAPAPAGQVSAVPAGVSVRAVFLTPSGDAYVDLSREIITGHPGGSLNEALTVYTLVNALTTNLHVTSVQLLVDGKPIDTLAGHLDLRQPLAAGTRWIQKGP